jgi:phenylacetate-CoA ligase
MSNLLSSIIYKLWDIKEGGVRLSEMANLKSLQYKSSEDIKKHQEKRLQTLISHAVEHSKWYKDKFQSLNLTVNDIKTIEDLKKLPVTTKLDIRYNGDAFISQSKVKGKLCSAKTGGSTGVSLDLYFDEYCQKLRNAAQGYADNLANWLPGDKIGSLWGNPPVASSLKEKLRSSLLEKTKYLDTMDLNPTSMNEFADVWKKFQPDILFGHAHSIFIFAKFLNENHIVLPSPNGIVATSMMLLDHERKVIERAFNTKVTNRYGCEEVGLIACECEQHNGMHINAPHIILECVDDNNDPVAFGESGKLVVTDLNNLAMPLIRYRIEDVGILSDEKCSCGRNFPLLKKLEGRVADFLKKEDGGLVGGVSLVERTLTNIVGIEQMQLIQKQINEIIINRVKGKAFDENTDDKLKDEMMIVFGSNMKLTINDVEKMPQESSGKYRFSICEV